MSNRVVAVAPRLVLDLSGLAVGQMQTIVLERALDVDDATEMELRVAVVSISSPTPSDVVFEFEVRPVFEELGSPTDVVGDPFAVAALDAASTPAGALVLVPLADAFAGPFQVSVRAAKPAAGSLSLVASVDLVTKSSRHAASRLGAHELARWHAALERSRLRFDGEAAAVRKRIAQLVRKLGPAKWLDAAATHLRGAARSLQHGSDSVARLATRCRCTTNAEAFAAGALDALRPLPLAVDSVWRPRDDLGIAADAGGGHDGPESRDPVRTCAAGVCRVRLVATYMELPRPLGGIEEVEFELCFPTYLDPQKPVGLFVVVHGAPDGPPIDDWFDPPSGAPFRPLQNDLARRGILAAFVRDTGGPAGMVAVVDAVKLYITTRAAEEPDSPLVGADTDAMTVALGGHSQGGAIAVLAALRASEIGIPVRAVVGLASGSAALGGEDDPVLLPPGTWYAGLVGTHDGSPSVLNTAPVKLFDRVSTDRPKVMVVARGVNHGHLGPGRGTAANVPGPYMQTTQIPITSNESFAVRTYVVSSFLRWAMFGDRDAAADLVFDAINNLAFAEGPDGLPVSAECGPTSMPVLAWFPEGDAGPLQPYRCRLIHGGATLDGVTALTSAIVDIQVVSFADETLQEPAAQLVQDCAGGAVDSPAPSSGHQGMVLLVRWDLHEADDADGGAATLRFAIPTVLADDVGGFQPPETFSLAIEIAVRVNSPVNVPEIAFRTDEWRPAIGLGDANGPQVWVRPQPLLYGFGYACPLFFTNAPGDQRRTVLTTISASVALLAPDGIVDATHVFVDLAWGAFERGECLIRQVSLVYRG